MSSALHFADTQPLGVDDIIGTFEEMLHHVGFINEAGEQIYPVNVEAAQYPEVTMEMSDGSRFKLTVEEVS